jgi:hypothetical protein
LQALLPLSAPYSHRRAQLNCSLVEYVPWYSSSAFSLFLSATVGPILLDRFEMTTLARLPFPLRLGRVMDATSYLQDSLSDLYSCPYSDAFNFLYDSDICIVYLYS